MKIGTLPVLLAVLSISSFATAQTVDRRQATISGGGSGGQGKCTIEVVVDGTVEIEIRGADALMRNLAGNPPQWRRFVCNSVMPRNPYGFRFAGVDGRGRQDLVREPRDGGPAVIRIDDPQGGSQGYTFDIFWGGGPGYPNVPGPGYPGPGYPGGGYPGGGNRFTREQAIRICQDSIQRQAIDRFRTRDVAFRRIDMDTQPGRNDWVVGVISIRRGGGEEAYRFSCSVNFDSGRVRTAQIEDRPEYPGGGGGGSSNRRAIENCQRAVEQRLLRDGYTQVDFRSINVDTRPGRADWIVGDARASGRNRPDAYDFSCSVNLGNGSIRSVDVIRR